MLRRLDPSEWADLAKSQHPGCVERIRQLLDRDGLVELDVPGLASGHLCTEAEAISILNRLVQLEAIERVTRYRCGCCQAPLLEEQAAEETCPECENAFADCPGGVLQSEVFVKQAASGRAVPWVLVLHGMNTAGAWQEELSWLFATTYGRSVPVFIYKYGRVRSGAFLRWRQRQLTQSLASRMRALSGEQAASRFGHKPDVLAHSLGTWLVGHVLMENHDLEIGRLILVGSILRPDFDWQRLVDRGQVEAVLNHYGSRDLWARLAFFAIPDAGPSGARGFDQPIVIERAEPNFSHSTFFLPARVGETFRLIWDLFLKRPTARLLELGQGRTSSQWKPTPKIMQVVTRLLLLSLIAGIAAFLVASMIVGAARIIDWAVFP